MKSLKKFIITIDTEADNQWISSSINTTKNVEYLPRFQELAEKYGFKPVWLCTSEIVDNNFFVSYMKDKQKMGLCEIGMHLHAWSKDINYPISTSTDNKPYLIEYPNEIMEYKIVEITNQIEKAFDIKPISHRSGRWATNDIYFDILKKYGYKIDCSVTPHVNWKNSLGITGIPGTDYSKCNEQPYFMKNGIFEIPVTIRKIHFFDRKNVHSIKSFVGEAVRLIFGRFQWVRPDKTLTTKGILKVLKKCSRYDQPIMFMIHSSELMPNGSPNFITEDDISRLYDVIELIFKYVKINGYEGTTLREYLYDEESDYIV